MEVKRGPETGLAEWTSRIKALQRQVDADEEAEQKRLEEEIAASRLARMSRRSRGPGRSMDLSKSAEFSKASREDPTVDDLQPVADRQKGQDDALRKLMGTSPSPPPSTTRIVTSPPHPPTPPKKPEAISLAAFMGGRGTGPRLNRHTAQQDAHDPTQFEQRVHISAPHPVFGRGGVAMPGMAAKGRSSIGGYTGAQERDGVIGTGSPTGTGNTIARERRVSTPGVARRYVEKIEERATHATVRPQRTGSAPNSRERTISTPTGISPARRSPLESYSRREFSPRPDSRSSITESRSKTPLQDRQIPGTTAKSPPASPSPIARPHTPRQLPVSSPVSSPPAKSSQSPVSTASLARPIQPDPKPPPQTPKIPASKNPSPAFLRAPAPKDPTPSISRLQGRGFVQSMVKVSTQLETVATGPGSPEKGRAVSERRKSILDRWQPAAAAAASVSPPLSPKPIPVRKSKAIDPSWSAEATVSPGAIKPIEGRPLKNVASLPSISHAQITVSPKSNGQEQLKAKRSIPDMSVKDAPGLGSSSTMISYVKPMKTGDDPQPEPGAPEVLSSVDELGVRANRNDNTGGGGKREGGVTRTSELPSPSRTPLSHPTKDRARKPRKAAKHGGNDAKHDERSGLAVVLPALAEPRPQPSLKPELHLKPVISLPTSSPNHQVATLSIPSAAALEEQALQRPSPVHDRQFNTGRLADRWQEKPIIGVKSVPYKQITPQGSGSAERKSESDGLVSPRALPGLTTPSPSVVVPSGGMGSSQDKSETNKLGSRPLGGLTDHEHAPSDQKETANNPPSTPCTPTRHSRIPSTGNRATVMDVAQTLNMQREPPPPTLIQERPESFSGDDDSSPADLPSSPVLSRGIRNVMPSSAQADRRKSSHEKYSAIMLPPLHEEKTPVASPAGTLSRSSGQMKGRDALKPGDLVDSLSSVTPDPANEDLVHFNHVDKALPKIDVEALLSTEPSSIFTPDQDIQNISVDLMAIIGSTASAISREINIFYDTEILAIIHRSKSKSRGLVSTTVWGWLGKCSHVGEREERKLQDLAKRYGTALTLIRQYCEPSELVHVLGGQLVIRQGTRTHWTSENTAMHLVRSLRGCMFIDEHDLGIKNLCSGFSYCLSVLDTLYVWYGRGSTAQERRAALEYARLLAVKGTGVIELSEGETDGDEMFWMILGDDDYAKADYWKWRRSTSTADPRIWRINTANTSKTVSPVPSFSSEVDLQTSVYVVDCVWEFFVLIGRDARGQREDTRLAISVAMSMSSLIVGSRPFAPPVHTLVLPTQLPGDLRLNFRDLDETMINNGEVPDHMNILQCKEALEHLEKTIWDKGALKDETMLPLGLDSAVVS